MATMIAGAGAARAQGLFVPPGQLPTGTGGPPVGVAPPAGVDTRVGDLRGYFAQAFGNVPAPEAATRSYTFTAALDVGETYDTAVAINGARTGHDLITQITPSIGVSADTARVTGSLFYSPTLNVYAFHGNQNNVQQNLNAAVTGIIVPDWLFIDLRGYAAQQSITGFNGPTGTTTLSRSDTVQTTSFSATPTLRHRFGDTAVAELSATLSRTTYDSGQNTQAAILNQTTIGQQEHAFLGTGPDFGRFSDSVTADAQQSSGTGLLTTASSQVFTDNVGYAINRVIALLGSIGHEDIHYSGATPYNINDVTWSGGARLTPDPDSEIDFGYAHQQGGSSFYLNASYQLTAQTHVFATYSQGIGTNASNLQSAVAGTTVGPNGITFNPTTGTPVLLNNNFAGVRPGLFRTTTASLSAVLVHPRDIYNVAFNHSVSSQVVSGIAGSSTDNSTTSTDGSFTWTHDLSTNLNSHATLQYGINSGPGFFGGTGSSTRSQGSLLVNVGLGYAVSDTLNVSADFTETTGPTGFTTTNGTREIATVSVHKTFY